jgi:hypothetical protein
MCRELDRGALSDPGVLELLERSVPLRIDLSRVPQGEVERYFRKGWPYLALEPQPALAGEGPPDPSLRVELSGMHDGQSLRQRLEEALAAAVGPHPPREWDDVRAEALRAVREQEAREALLEARELAPTDPDGARALLVAAAQRFAGTDLAADLELVLSRWREGKPFPELAES